MCEEAALSTSFVPEGQTYVDAVDAEGQDKAIVS
jgi:hypothetical protein